MSPEDIYETLRRYEFNKTEPETLRELVKSALKKGDLVRERMGKLKESIEEIKKIFKREHLFLEIHLSDMDYVSYRKMCAVGIDGSFQCVGGIGGIWYTPISCARIVFENGIESPPQASITAEIEEIDQHKYSNIEAEASVRMLLVETKAINEWVSISKSNSVIFVDGPLVDPPYYLDKNYVKYRCDAISRCLKKDILLIGCVKRIFGKPFINYVTHKILSDEGEKNRLKQFTSDIHLINYLFTKLYLSGLKGTLYTSPVDISEEDEVHRAYLKNGIRIFSVFMQKDAFSSPIRIDIPQEIEVSTDVVLLVEKVVKIVCAWTYPGYDIPLPIVLAHNKCTVRKGCAEVLYDEIITRAASPDPYDNIVKTKLG